MTAVALRNAEPAFAWVSAIALSLIANLVLVALLLVAIEPDAVPFTDEIKTRFQLSALDVPAHRAEAGDTTGEAAEESEVTGEQLGVRSVPSSRARPVNPVQDVQVARDPLPTVAPAVRPSAETMTAARAPSPTLTSAAPASAVITAQVAAGQRAVASSPPTRAVTAATAGSVERLVSQSAPDNEVLGAVPAQTQRTVASASRGPRLAGAVLPTATAPAAAAPASRLSGAAPEAVKLTSSGPTAERLAGVAAGGPAVAGVAPAAARAAPAKPEAIAVVPSPAAAVAGVVQSSSTATAAVATRAAIAWSGDSNMVLDEQSLAAIQSFMQPGEVAQSASFGGSVRDGIGAALAQFPCSRLQAVFQPETGQLEIRGHVPAPALKADVVAMLEQSVGGAIPVGSSLLVLPAPQCGVLETAEGLGFIQSKDQENDPLEVGREAQAQILSFEETQRVIFSLQAPEFDAYIYVDYYDKDGTVVHVLPNSYLENNRYPANANFTLGDGQGGGAGLEMRVAPPFSQDIAVVLGTTHPLHETQRPLQEDAEKYLSWLRNRIRDIQIEDPGFRGEWAYLFVRTGPQGAFK